jgi:hypothetical protein
MNDDTKEMLYKIGGMGDPKGRYPQPTLEDLMVQGATRMLNGRKITLGYTDEKKRIGWVWKDTGLPASMEKKK